MKDKTFCFSVKDRHFTFSLSSVSVTVYDGVPGSPSVVFTFSSFGVAYELCGFYKPDHGWVVQEFLELSEVVRDRPVFSYDDATAISCISRFLDSLVAAHPSTRLLSLV